MGWKKKALERSPGDGDPDNQRRLTVFTVTGSVVIVQPEEGIRDVSIEVGAQGKKSLLGSLLALLRRVLRI